MVKLQISDFDWSVYINVCIPCFNPDNYPSGCHPPLAVMNSMDQWTFHCHCHHTLVVAGCQGSVDISIYFRLLPSIAFVTVTIE